MNSARAILADVRDGRALSQEALDWFCAGLASGEVSDAQAGAFAMAVLLRGLGDHDGQRDGEGDGEGDRGAARLAQAMTRSGEVLRWDVPGPVLDKHSTGGVGDCVSLILAPALASCGAYVPMVSGRGLGHTGGTLDKLEAIPGFRSDMDTGAFQSQVARLGCAIVAANAHLSPADRRLYAVRDVTATVDSRALITASIVSKKCAAGISALVMDVKCGAGAFAKTFQEARDLAQSLTLTAQSMGCACRALITDMNAPLAPAAGNALEVAQVMEALSAPGPQHGPLLDVSCALGGEALALAGLAGSAAQGEAAVRAALTSGAAFERFAQMIAAQGGPRDFAQNWRRYLPSAPILVPVRARHDGFIRAIDTQALGNAVVALGGGRLRGDEIINPAVGLSVVPRIGDAIASGQVLALIHAQNEADAVRVQNALENGVFDIAPDAPSAPAPLILERVG